MHHSRLSPLLLISLAALALLGGCSAMAGKQDPGPEIAAAQETSVTTPAETATLLPRERSATQIARFENEQATVGAQSTSFALGTPYPTSPPFTPRPTTPAFTPVPGINTDCADADREFSFVNCWNALIGDEYVFADTVVLKADPSQAVLHVYTATLNLDDISPIESYPVMTRVGRVRIDGVSWPLMTLTALQTDPPTTFVFNLETRQWVAPVTTPTRITNPVYPAGDGTIVEDGQFVPSELGSFENQWQRRVGDVYTNVYFGREKYDRAQGIVLVWVHGPGYRMEMDIYRTPQARGAVRVVGATGTMLQARTEMGDYLVFDLTTREWVSPPTTPIPSRTRLSKEQIQQTRVAAVRAQTRTAVALTPTVDKRPEPPRTPRPTATIALGMLETCGQPLNSRQPHSLSCWRGMVNGRIVDVQGGFMIDVNHRQYGIVVVHTWYMDDYQVIAPPQRTGPLRITSINGMLFTLAADNPNATRVPYSSPTPYATFVFDLATRRWVSPAPTPVPSISPKPTQLP